MRKPLALLLTAILTFAVVPMTASAAAQSEITYDLDTTGVSKGTVGIRYEAPKGATVKARVTKSGVSYIYSLAANGTGWFPLQMGNGEYKVEVLEHVTGNKYRLVGSRNVDVQVKKTTDIYLNSVQNVNWKANANTVAKAKALMKNKTTVNQKVTAVYNYVTTYIKYDNELAATVKSEYVPNIDGTLASRKGICYGYSSLVAAMLRSQGIPTKLVMGTTTAVKGYHAWNEVYIDGKWVVIDTTVDAGLKQGGKKTTMAKKAADYKATKWY